MSANKRVFHGITAVFLASASGLVGAAGAFSADASGSSASLDFRVVIPKVMRIMENDHPLELPAPDRHTSRIAVQQRLVLMSTLPRGFCMDLQIGQQTLSDWQLQLSGSPGTWVQASGSGYRLCTGRAGRYDVALTHDFKASDMQGHLRGWPVQVGLTAP